jgi:hypothetical protein
MQFEGTYAEMHCQIGAQVQDFHMVAVTATITHHTNDQLIKRGGQLEPICTEQGQKRHYIWWPNAAMLVQFGH